MMELEWKLILCAFCAVILFILIIIFVVPTVLDLLGSVHPLIYETEQVIICSFKRGLCFYLVPKKPEAGSKVSAGMRTQAWYNDQIVCVHKVNSGVVTRYNNPSEYSCCTITDEKCKTDFEASSGVYIAFIDVDQDDPPHFDPEEPKSEEVKLETT